jgi:YD repeat-containing protein
MVNNLNMIAPVVEQSSYKDDQFLELVRTNYWFLLNGAIKPYTIESQTGTNPLIKRLTYNVYDTKCNPVHIIQNDVVNVVYLWSYNYLYPVAKIEGLTYAQVLNLYPQTSIDNLSKITNPTSDQINAIRTALAGQTALVTTFTYKPLVGMLSATAPNGLVTTYEYNSFNRLKYIKDNKGNIVKEDQYHYLNQ